MVRIARNKDSRVLAEMAVQMWDSHTVDELEAEFPRWLGCGIQSFRNCVKMLFVSCYGFVFNTSGCDC